MTEYLVARAEATGILDKLDQILADYSDRTQNRLPPDADSTREQILAWRRDAATDAAQIIQCGERELREGVQILGDNPQLQAVITAETPLTMRLHRISQFWFWLLSSGLVDDVNERTAKMARTTMPPESPDEITGAKVLEYLTHLHIWLAEAAEDLWGPDHPIELTKLGTHYGIGDYAQLQCIVHALNDGYGIRQHWIELARCGAYWDTVSVGAARARLIYKGVDVTASLLNPPV